MIKYGIPGKDILVTYSGIKVITLNCFQYVLKYIDIQKFGNKICFLAGNSINNKRKTNNIEIRRTNRGIKLGLGINQNIEKQSILNENNNYFEHEYLDYIYFLNIDKINNNLIKEILRSKDKPENELEIKQDKIIEQNVSNDVSIEQQSKSYDLEEQYINDEESIEYRFAPSLEFKVKTIEKKFNNGFNKGTHHYWSFQLALWMRDILKWDKYKANEKLLAWTEINKESVNNLNNSLNDAKHTIISVYDKDINKNYSLEKGLKEKSLFFYPHEIRLVKDILKHAKKEE